MILIYVYRTNKCGLDKGIKKCRNVSKIDIGMNQKDFKVAKR